MSTAASPGGLVIAGERSGVGKTTVTLALLAALAQKSPRVQSFKVGPDYIDPMFHQQATGRPCYNLDPILTSETYVQHCFAHRCQGADFALVEGVMGLFDGASGLSDVASTAHIARLLNLPVLLVVDCSRLSRSVLAIVHGYRSLDPRVKLAGVVLNRVGSDRHLELLTDALASIDLPILGVLWRQTAIALPDRHLGLVPTAELPQLPDILDCLAHLGHTCFDWDALTPLLETSSVSGLTPASYPVTPSPRHPVTPSPRIAIAQDPAFSFYYPDNLDILTALGAEIIPWSPLRDAHPPADADGLYFGGGFPEMFAAELAANQDLRSTLKALIHQGLPVYAECGGLMYLATTLVDLNDNAWPMVGVLPTSVRMTGRLTLGYRHALAEQSSLLLQAGQTIWGHEFHRSEAETPSSSPLYQLKRYGATQRHATEGWAPHRIHASYLHLHWGGCPEVAQALVEVCRQHRQGLSPGPD
ncbi:MULTISPECIES: cobyrinate a,c-diamide synthase [Cyanophyceae]|uniref:cobyrinate a,c-diamide synthase n=1 Tax=Cyanophyceae TaxID=3028117 RepID=UPI001688D0E8|nr:MULTISPECIES: cobyrinate a,c-diamide synthase [Cyanophyceae]MBD1917839.1 cobyrinate a,c-diamide synthase [Phormidium sp. FACHB-77]MBD2032957.1 cobyrinate a,c-diamide synthase [Phormidium sp. FACHB-322]MBD2051705.1 cobyrinate a,c-diamide synthase [Leptolyngbya sp. FACHB-60]